LEKTVDRAAHRSRPAIQHVCVDRLLSSASEVKNLRLDPVQDRIAHEGAALENLDPDQFAYAAARLRAACSRTVWT
jgi:hypothetical protein